ncbi:hypothetical protein ACFO25_14470 [Paenactinomyces guangxiensis]|uniref:Uncharacterized protein n=1 Tax=Paenactinomyces guangxiensis TaxID=1490290 RepID=A0A7W1WPZ6_9BACL|nr:hypothetical protein [Paenactinomyces guangxiensis]MBA4493930.1 hypothetical protein [Paenactinomyces guangxiensis]MBH8591397.1 hypothetical protein [Paenactinomyces guangxiensis]
MEWELSVDRIDHVEALPKWDRVYEVIEQMDGKKITNFILDPLNGGGCGRVTNAILQFYFAVFLAIGTASILISQMAGAKARKIL